MVQSIAVGVIGSFQESRSLFYINSLAVGSFERWSSVVFAIRHKDNEPLKEYLLRFNVAVLEVPSATQEVKTSAFSQGLLDGVFFKSLAKKPISKFGTLLARAAKYINIEDAQAAKKKNREGKIKETKEEGSSKKLRTDFWDKKPPLQRINVV
ncbi:UNVERIFIED_CONTAM: hypothetical protein Sradi_6236400 [Sesamum radiatum]|uniref:Uncharacterized protein n=1 Tax=Sesamum radiatum TaxID=300843 RepID=A0AAW2KCV3_SESRA